MKTVLPFSRQRQMRKRNCCRLLRKALSSTSKIILSQSIREFSSSTWAHSSWRRRNQRSETYSDLCWWLRWRKFLPGQSLFSKMTSASTSTSSTSVSSQSSAVFPSLIASLLHLNSNFRTKKVKIVPPLSLEQSATYHTRTPPITIVSRQWNNFKSHTWLKVSCSEITT